MLLDEAARSNSSLPSPLDGPKNGYGNLEIPARLRSDLEIGRSE